MQLHRKLSETTTKRIWTLKHVKIKFNVKNKETKKQAESTWIKKLDINMSYNFRLNCEEYFIWSVTILAVFLQIWRIEDFTMVPLENIHYGEFYGGDCYVILYTYQVQGRERYIVYYWLVRCALFFLLLKPEIYLVTGRWDKISYNTGWWSSFWWDQLIISRWDKNQLLKQNSFGYWQMR